MYKVKGKKEKTIRDKKRPRYGDDKMDYGPKEKHPSMGDDLGPSPQDLWEQERK